MEREPGIIYISPVYCACATVWSSTSGGTCLCIVCTSSSATSCDACRGVSSCGSNAYSANGTVCTSHVQPRPGCSDGGWWSSRGMRVFTWCLISSPEVGCWQEGRRQKLFFIVFIFVLTFSLRRGVLLWSYIYLMRNKSIFLKLKWLKQNSDWYLHVVSMCMWCVSPHKFYFDQ